MANYKLYTSALFKVILGALFIVSALLKLSSIDSFELYIFSFNIFSLNMAALVARTVIGAELVLGIGYIINIYHKLFFRLILASLVGFTLFLIYLVFTGSEDNCHCFGDLVDISPLESIAKNAIMILMLYLSKGVPAWNFDFTFTISSKPIERYKLYILLATSALIIIPFVRFPPHAIYNLVNKHDEDHAARNINLELFNEFLEENPQIEWGSRTKIIAFYGTQCKYCKISAQQISQIVRRNDLPSEAVELVFWGDDDMVSEFFEQTNSIEFRYEIIDAMRLINITQGKFPTLIFYDQDAKNNIRLHNVRSIEESVIIDMLR